jgi:predicted amidohydrolase
MTAVALANYAAPRPGVSDPEQCNGHSVAFSGIAYGEEGRALEHKLVEAGEEEDAVIAELDLEALRTYRTRETWGDAYRKPDSYGSLVSNRPLPVFRRRDSRR